MENAVNIIWNELPIFALSDLYSSIPLAKVSWNWIDAEPGEHTRAYGKKFESLLEEVKDLVLLAEISVMITEKKIELDSLEISHHTKWGNYIYSNLNKNKKSVWINWSGFFCDQCILCVWK